MGHENSHFPPRLRPAGWNRARFPAVLLIGLLAVLPGAAASRAQQPPNATAPRAEDQLLLDLPEVFLDVIVRKALAESLISAQKVVVDHLLSTTGLSPALRDRVVPYRNGQIEGPPRDPTFIPLEGGAGENAHAEQWGVWLLDLRQLTAGFSTDLGPCPDLRPGEDAAVEVHNLIVMLIRNVHRLCGEPVQWQPDRESRSWETFDLLHAEPHFATLHIHYQNPGPKFGISSLFGLTGSFWTANHFLYLEKSVQARCFRLVRNEFLAPRRDLEERYPEMEYLRHDLSYIVWARLTTC